MRLLCALCVLCGYLVPVSHQFCFLFGNSPVDLVHSVFHPWIAAVWRPCLALGYCFIGKVCLEGLVVFLTELTKFSDHQEVGSSHAEVRLLLSDTRVSSVLSVVKLFRVFTSFVSFSVIRLSFSSCRHLSRVVEIPNTKAPSPSLSEQESWNLEDKLTCRLWAEVLGFEMF
jgi:hypothetical protein